MKSSIQLVIMSGLLIMFTLGCEPAPDDLFVRRFYIEKGEHYSTPRIIETMQTDRLIFTAQFDESAMYDLGDQSMQSNKNKLLGFADCNSLHHENSARFAWQWYKNQLEIYAYCYVNSERIEKFVGVVNINELNHYEIQVQQNQYVFRLNQSESVQIERASTCNSGVYYMLWPYFGGSMPAPKQVKIDIAITPL